MAILFFFFSSEQFTFFTGAVLNAIKMCLMAMSECRLKRTKKNMFVDLFQCFFSRLCAHKKKKHAIFTSAEGRKTHQHQSVIIIRNRQEKKYFILFHNIVHFTSSVRLLYFLFHLPKKFALFTLVVMA